MTKGKCDGPHEYFCFRKVTPANHSPWSCLAGKRPGILHVFQVVTSLSLARHYWTHYQQPVGDILYISHKTKRNTNKKNTIVYLEFEHVEFILIF